MDSSKSRGQLLRGQLQVKRTALTHLEVGIRVGVTGCHVIGSVGFRELHRITDKCAQTMITSLYLLPLRVCTDTCAQTMITSLNLIPLRVCTDTCAQTMFKSLNLLPLRVCTDTCACTDNDYELNTTTLEGMHRQVCVHRQ